MFAATPFVRAAGSVLSQIAVPGALLREELGLRPAAVAVLRALLRFVVPLGIAATALAPLLL